MAQSGFMSLVSSQTAPSLPDLRALNVPLPRLLQGAHEAAPLASRDTPSGRIYLGHGQPVIVLPMLCGGPQSTARIRHALDEAGFQSYDWGLGVDTGPRDRDLNRLLCEIEEKVIDVAETERASVTLLGWGLSGIYARELARRADPLVRQVITLGTPYNTAADPQRRCMLFKVLGAGGGDAAFNLQHRLREDLPVPSTSIYSRDDGVVAWQLCVGSTAPHAESIEIEGARHRDLPAHPLALEIITERLAQPDGHWQPFQARSGTAPH